MTSLILLFSMAFAQAPNGAALFQDRCATCHAATTDARIPPVDALRYSITFRSFAPEV